MKKKRVSKLIQIGEVAVGGDSPITVQSMTKTDTRDVAVSYTHLRAHETDS